MTYAAHAAPVGVPRARVQHGVVQKLQDVATRRCERAGALGQPVELGGEAEPDALATIVVETTLDPLRSPDLDAHARERLRHQHAIPRAEAPRAVDGDAERQQRDTGELREGDDAGLAIARRAARAVGD